jgi:hypothetical protein
MPIQEERHKFELCKRRGVDLHALITEQQTLAQMEQTGVGYDMAENRPLKKTHEPDRYEFRSLPVRYNSKRYGVLWAAPKLPQEQTFKNRLEYNRQFFIDEPVSRRLREDDETDEIRVRLSHVYLCYFLFENNTKLNQRCRTSDFSSNYARNR